MSSLRGLLAILICLGLQAGLGYLWPLSGNYVDLMLLPVCWYGITHSQRGAMLVGCGGGLLQDAWLHAGTLGINGFKKTLIGWALGGLGSRFDLNQPLGRFVSGAAVSLADSLLDVGLRQLLDQRVLGPVVLTVVVRALVTGLLMTVSFRWMERLVGRPAGVHLESRA